MLQNVRISVGRTWRFATDGAATVGYDLTGYRGRIDRLKGGGTASEFTLPWPPYRSRLWARMYGGAYQDRKSEVLVAALLPLLYQGRRIKVPRYRPGEAEALLHPFALTTLVHLDLASWPAGRDGVGAVAADLLRSVLAGPLTAGAQVRDGLPLSVLPPLPTVDADGVAADFVEAGAFILVSALHEGAPDPAALAGSLAVLFNDAAASGAQPVKSTGGALCLSDDVAGLVLPNSLPRAGDRIRCLHRNYATLLAYVQNLATVTPAVPTEACRWFQTRAAEVLNHLYRRAPLPWTGSIYRSRLPEVWIQHRGLAAAINALAEPRLPALPP